MARRTFIRNRRLEQQLRAQPAFRRAVRATAEPARRAAETIDRSISRWPWMPRKGAGRNIDLQDTSDGVALVNRDYAAHLKEFGSARNPPHAPLRRGVRSAGLRLDDSR